MTTERLDLPDSSPTLAELVEMLAAEKYADLLAAARAVLRSLETADIANDTLIWIDERERLRAAIAKAEGRA